jgi:hypothetical protein
VVIVNANSNSTDIIPIFLYIFLVPQVMLFP